MVKQKPHIIIRIAALVFAANIFVLPLLVFTSIAVIKKWQHELLYELAETPDIIELTETEFKSLKFIEEDEIVFNGKMYDVKSIKKQGSKYIIHALADEKETLLNDIAGKNPAKNKLRNKYFPLLFFDVKRTGHTIETSGVNAPYGYTECLPCKEYREVFSPPPETLL